MSSHKTHMGACIKLQHIVHTKPIHISKYDKSILKKKKSQEQSACLVWFNYWLIVEALLYLSQLTDLFRQASNLRVGDTARVLVGHVVHQRVHLSGQVPSREHETCWAHTWLCMCSLLNHYAIQCFAAHLLLERCNSTHNSQFSTYCIHGVTAQHVFGVARKTYKC